ncbi:DUF4375 domain-containing protein [Bacillus sp. JJ1566]|uniref:DMP19 family protein n=1 Tax=Bacillus sp. JJ1566 TaxID=3122961 RepID=UPI002FFEDF5D
MNERMEILKPLISLSSLIKESSEKIIEEVASNLYKEESLHLTEKNTFYKLPEVIRDIILIINLDTELTMQGILGFLENSTGLFLDDTIETLCKIKAVEDYIILKEIRSIIIHNGITTMNLGTDVNNQEEYSRTNFNKTHGPDYSEMAEEISEIAIRLYIYSEDRNLFDLLIEYVEKNKAVLIEEVT